MYSIHFKTSVEKDLRSIPSNMCTKILEVIELERSEFPERHKQLKGKYKALRTLRVGNYRVLYTVQ